MYLICVAASGLSMACKIFIGVHGLSGCGANILISLCVLSCFSSVWACQAPLSMGFSRQEYYSGLPCPPPGDLPDPGIEPESLMSPALVSRFFTELRAGWAAVHGVTESQTWLSDLTFTFHFHALETNNPGGTFGKELACQCRRLRDVGLIPGSGRSPGKGHGNPLKYSCLKNPWTEKPGVYSP